MVSATEPMRMETSPIVIIGEFARSADEPSNRDSAARCNSWHNQPNIENSVNWSAMLIVWSDDP
jgi:hypothetical protein